jgi:succinate dehydrogenase / fumarate reductase cytochrome b subunit
MTTTTLSIRDTTVGKKAVLALSGVILFGFAVVHMLGNMQIFVGREVIDGYHVMLYGMPGLLWTARVVLLLALVAHATTAVQLARLNRAARPERYARSTRVATSYAARTMLWGGILLLLYLVHHVAHMTAGFTAGLGYAHDHVDVYGNLVRSYRVPWMAGLSIVAAIIFGIHVRHGAWSLFQSLGIHHPRHTRLLRSVAIALALVVTAGYIAVPLAVVTGLVG